MSVTSVDKDVDSLTLTLLADLDILGTFGRENQEMSRGFVMGLQIHIGPDVRGYVPIRGLLSA